VSPSTLDQAYREATKCNRCGFCQTACPVYQVTRKESSTARGHHYQVRSTFEGRLPVSPGLTQPLDECLLCRACVPQCAPRVQTDQVVAGARHALSRNDGRTSVLTTLLRRLLLRPGRLDRYVGLASRAEAMGVFDVAALGGRNLSRARHLVGHLPSRSFLAGAKGITSQVPAGKERVAYFVGCGVNHLLPEIGEATVGVLQALGYGVSVSRSYCCGLPSYANGDLDTARRLARGNLRLLKHNNVASVVTDCASCSSFLKGYAELLEDDPAFGPLASEFSEKVLDITELLARSTYEPQSSELPLKVTYHDPCHASRYQGLKEEPRSILRSIPGLTLIEMQEADWCCGGAGTYSIKHPDLSDRILDRKIDNVARTGADLLVTSCPSCIIQLSSGVRRHNLPVKVLHLSLVLAMARTGGLPNRTRGDNTSG